MLRRTVPVLPREWRAAWFAGTPRPTISGAEGNGRVNWITSKSKTNQPDDQQRRRSLIREMESATMEADQDLDIFITTELM